MRNLENKQTGKVYTNSGDGKYAYWNEDGGFYLTNEFGQKQKSAGLVGRFECYWLGPKKAKIENRYGFWRSERTGLGKTGRKVDFKENDTMDLIFQGELTDSLKTVQSNASNFDEFKHRIVHILSIYNQPNRIQKDNQNPQGYGSNQTD